MNAYEQLIQVRDQINEASASHWSDREVLKNINLEQAKLARIVAMAPGDWLVKRATVTPVDSVITFPGDCSKPVYLEEVSNQVPVQFTTTVRERMVSRLPASTIYTGISEAYMLRNTIVVNQASYSTQCYLWYQLRVPDLHVGTAGAGGASSITLSAHDGVDVAAGGFGASLTADYYNGVTLEVFSGTGSVASTEITDYSGSRVATVTGTFGADSDYGTISMLPIEAHGVMLLGAAKLCLAKPSASIDPKYYQIIAGEYREQFKIFDEWISSRIVGSNRIRETEID